MNYDLITDQASFCLFNRRERFLFVMFDFGFDLRNGTERTVIKTFVQNKLPRQLPERLPERLL